MPIRRSGTEKVYWKTQLPVDYIDTSLVINTWENVSTDLSGGKPAKLWFIIIEQTNNGAAVETIVLEITVNGTAYTVTLTGIASEVPSYVFCYTNLTTGDFTFAANTTNRTVGSATGLSNAAVPFIAESVGLVRVKQTTDVDGTSAQIEVNIVWDKLVGV